MTEGAITLAGFAAAFRASAGVYDPDGHSRTRLNSVIEGGLTVASVSYLPAWLFSAGFSESAVWRGPSGLIVVWGIVRIIVPTSLILRSGVRILEMFVPVVVAGVVAIAAATLNVFGASPMSD